jgi:UDP-N-acetylmuramoyl-tripeptide--D-alanyl-D-alanine ligase
MRTMASVWFDHHSDASAWVVVALGAVASGLAGVRWLRVAQREHYLAGSVVRFAVRWWVWIPLNAIGMLAALAGVVLTGRFAVAGVVPVVIVGGGPLGLSLRGRSSPLAWTRRLRTLAALWAALQLVVIALGVLWRVAPFAAVLGAVAVPVLVDVACAITAPVERRLAGRHVTAAAERLARIAPTVVAITGSYGKTSTKGYVAHLLSGSRSTVASPASFNNRAGLSRAVNEHLTPGTDVFVAEMGTYGPGEIAELCAWMTPDVAVITAIGPVHLERFGTEDRIVRAKAEILAEAASVVLVIDDPRLAALADRAGADAKRVWRVSAVDPDADVSVLEHPDGLTLRIGGHEVARAVAVSARPGNVAAAVAVALQLGVLPDDIARRLPSLPSTAHRLEAATAPSGTIVLDDTYNANPAGARVALGVLRATGEANAAGAGAVGEDRRRVVVTPGMVELGRRQAEENALFAGDAARIATDLVVVGRTNRRALVRGARDSSRRGGSQDVMGATARTITVADRRRAVQWVRDHLGAGDVVLYENDLPDQYP